MGNKVASKSGGSKTIKTSKPLYGSVCGCSAHKCESGFCTDPDKIITKKIGPKDSHLLKQERRYNAKLMSDF